MFNDYSNAPDSIMEVFMKKILLTTIVALMVSLLSVGLSCADQASDAKALVEKSVAMVKNKGLKATLEAINDLKGPFVKGELYIFAMSLENMRLAAGSPSNKNLLGTVAKNPFNKTMLDIAKSKGSGWVEYSWPKPGGKEPSPKRSYIMRVPGENAYFGCGYYVK
jgi:cytochrome c